MVTTLIDVILKCILIAMGAIALIMMLAICTAIIGIALKDRKEQKRVHSVSEHRD